MPLTVVRTVEEIRTHVAKARQSGKTTCVVPTMGGLHAGHMSLVEKAGKIADFVVVTLFVNPTQFNNPDDFSNYPGNEETDLKLLTSSPADIVFAPTQEEMYPAGFSTSVKVDAAADILCDKHRPGHFDGVGTVVTKLFLQTGTEFACFGEKDYQQLFIIRQLVKDLNIPIEIIPVETVRESDGLALSSRNARLSSQHRQLAPELNNAMQKAAQQINAGHKPADACQASIRELQKFEEFKVEYLEVRSAETLQIVSDIDAPARIFAAAWLGDVRLIDNIAI